jgi:hypothetical protein
VSFHLETIDGRVTYPFGPDAIGYVMFSEDGFMSVSVMSANRPKFSSADIMRGSTEEKVKAAETYIAYCGKYEIQDREVTIHPEVSFFPNWVGVDQIRIWDLVADRLTLTTPPLLVAGEQQTAQIVWNRV